MFQNQRGIRDPTLGEVLCKKEQKDKNAMIRLSSDDVAVKVHSGCCL